MLKRFAPLLASAGVICEIGLMCSAKQDQSLRDEAKRAFGMVHAVPESKQTEPDVQLGRSLFWDERLSANAKIACASCHLAKDWGADARQFSLDARGKSTTRNSQTVFNAMLQPMLRWTGDRQSGAHQAEKSLTGSMGFKTAEEVVPLLKKFGYEPRFRDAFRQSVEAVSPTNYALAIQAYEATLVTPAPFDRYLDGQDNALNATQLDGLKVFLKTGCVKCHSGQLLGGGTIRRFGVEKDYWLATMSSKKDAGLFDSTKVEPDRHKFRVAMLRNVAKTGPYFHDGSIADLKKAVHVMADVQLGNQLSDKDSSAIVEFLKSLTGDVPAHYGPPPQ